jgi:hypothetical protein
LKFWKLFSPRWNKSPAGDRQFSHSLIVHPNDGHSIGRCDVPSRTLREFLEARQRWRPQPQLEQIKSACPVSTAHDWDYLASLALRHLGMRGTSGANGRVGNAEIAACRLCFAARIELYTGSPVSHPTCFMRSMIGVRASRCLANSNTSRSRCSKVNFVPSIIQT